MFCLTLRRIGAAAHYTWVVGKGVFNRLKSDTYSQFVLDY